MDMVGVEERMERRKTDCTERHHKDEKPSGSRQRSNRQPPSNSAPHNRRLQPPVEDLQPSTVNRLPTLLCLVQCPEVDLILVHTAHAPALDMLVIRTGRILHTIPSPAVLAQLCAASPTLRIRVEDARPWLL
jgi:hypothetical protein